MKIETRAEGSYSIMALSGEIDFHYSPTLRKEIIAEIDRGQNIVLDMSGVTYISSSGIATMVESLQHAKRKDRSFSLAHLTDSVMEVLKLTRLDTILNIHESVEAATGSGAR